MPMANTPYSSLLVDPESLGADPETAEPAIAVCHQCRIDLKAGRVPSLSVANNNYLSPIPPELKGLTVVEEAMVALCRAKCWIIQLRDGGGGSSIPTTSLS
jgi:hypothetical protein